jgi:hypothetical protein
MFAAGHDTVNKIHGRCETRLAVTRQDAEKEETNIKIL